MIRIHRGREPAALRTVRRDELVRIRPLTHVGPPGRDDIGEQYTLVKRDLWNAQHYKCCYCEKQPLEATRNDVEHFRPKTRARRGTGFPDHGYWWLAWTWNNLMFACDRCNRDAKADQFPLDAGSVALVPEEALPGNEHPLLIDPSRENPFRHIQFNLVMINGSPGWRPFPRSGSRKGDETIRVLKLDRPELLDLYGRHVGEYATPVVTKLQAAMNANQGNRVQELWGDEVARLVNPRRPFTALSYDVFDHFFPIVVRRRWGLSLVQPG
jgi:uncharacterized protein (TIGR02646 family)